MPCPTPCKPRRASLVLGSSVNPTGAPLSILSLKSMNPELCYEAGALGPWGREPGAAHVLQEKRLRPRRDSPGDRLTL